MDSLPKAQTIMNSVPRLTIGLPVYDGGNFLAESFEALPGQSYEDFELIISDNASTDDTEHIPATVPAVDIDSIAAGTNRKNARG